MRALLLGESSRGGFHHYASLLRAALGKAGVSTTTDWRKALSCDVIHYQFDDLFPLQRLPLLAFLFLCRLLGKPVVVTAHNPCYRGSRNPLKNLFYLAATRVVTHNPCSWSFSGKTVVIPHGNYCFFLDYAPKEAPEQLKKKWGVAGKEVILSYGFLRPSKNYRFLVDVIDASTAIHPDAVLLVAGHGGDNETRALLQCAPRVRLVNRFLSERETAELFSLADAVVLAAFEHDHSGIPHIAYCFEKHVVAPPNLAHQVSVTANSVDRFAAALDKILREKKPARAEKQRELEEFSWEKIAAQTLDLYRQLLP